MYWRTSARHYYYYFYMKYFELVGIFFSSIFGRKDVWWLTHVTPPAEPKIIVGSVFLSLSFTRNSTLCLKKEEKSHSGSCVHSYKCRHNRHLQIERTEFVSTEYE